MRSPHLDGFGDPVAVMVLGAGPADVETVIVGGDVVKRDGQLVGAHVERAHELMHETQHRLRSQDTPSTSRFSAPSGSGRELPADVPRNGQKVTSGNDGPGCRHAFDLPPTPHVADRHHTTYDDPFGSEPTTAIRAPRAAA